MPNSKHGLVGQCDIHARPLPAIKQNRIRFRAAVKRRESFTKVKQKLMGEMQRPRALRDELINGREILSIICKEPSPEDVAKFRELGKEIGAIKRRLKVLDKHYGAFVRLINATDSQVTLQNLEETGVHLEDEAFQACESDKQKRRILLRKMDEEEYAALRFRHFSEAKEETETPGPDSTAIVETGGITVSKEEALAELGELRKKASNIGQTLELNRLEVIGLLEDYSISQLVALANASKQEGLNLRRMVAVDLSLAMKGEIKRVETVVSICNVHAEMSRIANGVLADKLWEIGARKYLKSRAEIGSRLHKKLVAGEIAPQEVLMRLGEKICKLEVPVKQEQNKDVSLKLVLEIYDLLNNNVQQLYDFLEYFRASFKLDAQSQDYSHLPRVKGEIAKNRKFDSYVPTKARIPTQIIRTLIGFVEDSADELELNTRSVHYEKVRLAFERGHTETQDRINDLEATLHDPLDPLH